MNNYPFTFFNFGLLIFAFFDAFLVADAKIAPAACLEIPSLEAILFWTAANPGCLRDFVMGRLL